MQDALVPASPPPHPNSRNLDWQILTRTETPDGKIKMKFKNSPKPSKASQNAAGGGTGSPSASGKKPSAVAHFPLRISRRMSMEIGISAAELSAVMTARSPSPKKRPAAAPETSRDHRNQKHSDDGGSAVPGTSATWVTV